MYVVIFICLLFLAFDFVCFSATYSCYKSYKSDLKSLSDNIETLITSVESNNLSDVCLAVDNSSSSESSESSNIVHEHCSIFLDKKTGQRLVVPDSLYLYYYPDDDYLEL